jgi:hypothetical protein
MDRPPTGPAAWLGRGLALLHARGAAFLVYGLAFRLQVGEAPPGDLITDVYEKPTPQFEAQIAEMPGFEDGGDSEGAFPL